MVLADGATERRKQKGFARKTETAPCQGRTSSRGWGFTLPSLLKATSCCAVTFWRLLLRCASGLVNGVGGKENQAKRGDQESQVMKCNISKVPAS